MRAAEGRVACACAAAGLRHDARLCRNGAPHRRQDGARSSPSETVTVDCLTRSRLRLEDQKQEAGSRGAVRSENTELNTAVEVFNSVASFVVRTRISFEIGCRSVASGRTPFRKGYVPPPSVTRSGTAPFKWGSGPRGAPPLGWHHQQVTLYNISYLGMYRTRPPPARPAQARQQYHTVLCG